MRQAALQTSNQTTLTFAVGVLSLLMSPQVGIIHSAAEDFGMWLFEWWGGLRPAIRLGVSALFLLV